MKSKYLIFALLLSLLYSCEDGDSVDISSLTVFPALEYEPIVAVELGGQFTPTATAFEGENELEVSVDGSVDNTTIGIYSIQYSASNSEGYDKVGSQTVAVYDPSITATDVSGKIMDKGRNERTGEISLVSGTTNIFYGTDMGFGGVFPLYFMMDGDNMVVIPQELAFSATSVDASYDPVAKEFSVTIYPYEFSYNFQYQ